MNLKKGIILLILMMIFSCKKRNRIQDKINNLEKIVKVGKEKNNKKHIILPSNIRFQLKDKKGNNFKIENILCHLNIYIDSLSYYTYSFIPTDTSGGVNITKEQIIENTELKHYYDERIILNKSPVKFDFFVINDNRLKGIISSMKNYLTLDLESIKTNLKNSGLTSAQIAAQISGIEEKMKSDKRLYEFLKKNNNTELNFSEGEIKITGLWNKESDFNYNLSLKQ